MKLIKILTLLSLITFTGCKLEPVKVKNDSVYADAPKSATGSSATTDGSGVVESSTKVNVTDEDGELTINVLQDADKVVYKFFDEDYMPGGFNYAYPSTSKITSEVGDTPRGEGSYLRFNIDPNDYSGGAICLYNMKYDLRPYFNTGVLRFWVKSKTGTEQFQASFSDDDANDGLKTVTRMFVDKYAKLKAGEWVKVDIPLRDFGARGVFWDDAKKVEVPTRFQWGMVTEFRIELKKGQNASFDIAVDDIQILKNMLEPVEIKDEIYWDEIVETVDGPADFQITTPDNIISEVYGDGTVNGGFTYTYGGKTSFKDVKSNTANNSSVLATYMDDNEYSGVSISFGNNKSVDVSNALKKGGITFWAKGHSGGEKFYVGLLDDESDGPEMKVQSKVVSLDHVKLTTEWQQVKILFKSFSENGKWWNSSKQAEIFGKLDWAKIQELRFSVNKFENKNLKDAATGAVKIYFDQVQFQTVIDGVFDPEEYWAAFSSNEADVLLFNFEDRHDNRYWMTPHHPAAEIKAISEEPPAGGPKELGTTSLSIEYKLAYWADCLYDLTHVCKKPTCKQRTVPNEMKDWSKHWALKFWFYTEKPYEAITISVNDAGNEVWFATAGAQKGWHEILIPLKDFKKFPFYQPENAEENGIFDMNGMKLIDFKPSNDGTKGKFRIDEVYLTNDKAVQEKIIPPVMDATIKGDMSEVVNPKVNPALYGQNIALWDGDLLKDNTVKYCKEVKHGVYRYPGGLRADDDHWEDVLKKKDWMVDTDEMIEWVESVDGEAMITVNFGKGTPEEAARWVERMNIQQKRNVRYWEVGNELYGNWHPDHCTAEEYGKRARDFIIAMKKVDPTIMVTVVWELEGEWNKIVFDHTKDVVDGVNVHHYPQHFGQENDFAILAAPDAVKDILGGVQNQVKEHGVPGKKYEVWLTEWNSVDFNPGPQTVSIVNGLFVADYLAQLAHTNIDAATYWDIHNDITPELGDYGYLSRTGAPDGDNIPRSSYWAFKIIANNLQGKMIEVQTGIADFTSYFVIREDGSKALIVINKSPATDYKTTINIKGLKGGNAIIEEYRKTGRGTKSGFSWDQTEIASKGTKSIKNGDVYTFPKYTVTVFQWDTQKSHTNK